MATGKERKQARADRYRERALQAKAGSTAAYRRSEELTKNIPSGQPILVGHHSEKRHRRALECSWNALGKSVELERKADYYAAKAEAAEHNRAIYAEDDDAVENLTERVAALESLQERMKAANRIIKSLKQTQEEKIEALCKLFLGLGLAWLVMNRLGDGPLAAAGSIAGVTIGTVLSALYLFCKTRRRTRELSRAEGQARPAGETLKRLLKSTPTKEYTIGEVRIVENTEANRLQVFFPEKPSETVRKELKSNGFRWASIAACWQSYLNERQKYRIERILKNETAKS